MKLQHCPLPSLQWRLLLLTLPILHLLSQSQAMTINHRKSDLKIFHKYSPASPLRPPTSHLPWADTVLQMQSSDQARLQYLSSLVARKSDLPVGSGRQLLQSPTYIVKAEFGTPGQALLMALDNSIDAAWVPCLGCDGCPSTLFNPTQSSTFSTIPCGAAQCSQVPNPSCSVNTCGFNYTYGNSNIQAALATDTLKLAQDPIPSYTFGCIELTTGTSTPPQGLLGLGRGPLSLLSQSATLYNSTFSYCLPSFKSTNFTGSLRLGPVAQPKKIKTTPLLKNPRRPSLYYVNMTGLKVGSKAVVIPTNALSFDATTGAGTIFDSGTSFTSLVKPVYIALREEFRRRMGNATVSSLGGFDTCYTVPITIPSIAFIFDGMQVTLPPDNFLIRSSAGTTSCLAMAATPDNAGALNVISGLQQQNHRIFFDVPNSRVGVARQACS